jgi:hypothetical protein
MNINFTLGIPQLIMCAIYIWNLGMYAVNHGKSKEDKYNFWHCLVGTAIIITILKWGGFFG